MAGNGFGDVDALPALITTHDVPPPAVSGALHALSEVPQLSSRPGAPARVYLEFRGVDPMLWGHANVPATPAYDVDSDAATFSDTEMRNIYEVWGRVAEKYSPFNVDVTTVDPGTYNWGQTVRVVIGGNSTWAGGVYGGYGYVNGFTGPDPNTVFVFPKNLGGGLPKYVAEAAAHEAGHAFGLQHQAAYSATGAQITEYNRGTDATAPIMGFSYYAQRGLWWDGPTQQGTAYEQNDLNIINSVLNGFHYAPDDYVGVAELTAGVDGVATKAGVIEQMADSDTFHFHSDGGLVQLTANVADYGAMLDLSLKLTDAQGAELAFADTASLGESVSAMVPAGDYFLTVASHGGYGDIGQYSITGTLVPEPGSAAVLLMGVAWVLQKRPAIARKRHGQAIAPRNCERD